MPSSLAAVNSCTRSPSLSTASAARARVSTARADRTAFLVAESVVAPTPLDEGQRPTPHAAHPTPLPLPTWSCPHAHARGRHGHRPRHSPLRSTEGRQRAACTVIESHPPARSRCASCNSSCVQRLPLLLHLPAARAIHRRRLRVHVLRHVDEHCCSDLLSRLQLYPARTPQLPTISSQPSHQRTS